jgi:hypothetical protein
MADEQETDTTEEVDETTDTVETEDAGTETEAADKDTTEDEWKSPTKEEWDKLQKAQKDAVDKLAKVNKESMTRRQKIRDLERQGEDEAAKAKREAEESAQARIKPVFARNALLEAQVQPGRVDAVIKLVNLDAVEFDDNGEVSGLAEEVDRIKELLPEVFIQPQSEKPDTAPAPRPAPKAATAPKKPAKTEERSAGERIAAQLLGTR